MGDIFQQVWRYRHFIKSSIKAEFKGQFATSKLGLAWLIIHPLAQAGILALVLSQILGARLSGIDSDYAYAIYLLSGILAWNLFSETSNNAISMFRARANLIKKVSFPKICIPIIVVGGALTNHLLFLVIVIALIWLLGIAPSIYVILIPLLFCLTIGLAMGIGLILAIFDTFNRDVGNAWAIFSQFLFWLTPIVYSPDILPAFLKEWIILNPMYSLVSSYQNILAFNQFPELQPLLILSMLVFMLLAFGLFLFSRSYKDIIDAL